MNLPETDKSMLDGAPDDWETLPIRRDLREHQSLSRLEKAGFVKTRVVQVLTDDIEARTRTQWRVTVAGRQARQ